MTIPPPPAGQLKHEAPELGDAVVRLLRALVTRSAHGDTFAIEQLARIEELAPIATSIGARLAHDHNGYSYTQVAAATGVSRQAARQRAVNTFTTADAWELSDTPEAHQLLPGHDKRTCELASCHRRWL